MEDKKSSKTKKVKTVNSNKKNKNNKMKFKDKHPRILTVIKIALVVFFLFIIIGCGVLAGTFFGVFGDELKISEESLVVGYENSTVYDADGNFIATLSGGTKRKSISLSEMSEYLPKAYVAIEDERFYEHSGIDVKRTTAATVTYALHGGKSSFGGSTITQQVIKNITKEKDNTALAGVMRKVKEISKSIQVEHYLSKDQILELYLNLIFVGGDDINGVELGSVYYFDKSAKDLSIAECAFLAGINHSPNAYKPFEDYAGEEDQDSKKEKMTDKINKRTKTVLGKMKELEYITEDQYNEAIAEVDSGLNFKKGESASVTTDVSYHTEAAIDQIIDQIMEENEDMSKDMAEMYLYSSGFKIYTTQKTDIQNRVEEEVAKSKYITKATYTDNKTKEKITEYSMPTMVIINHKTGEVVAASAASGDENNRNTITKLGYFNIPTSLKKATGSSMKPISVIAPGLETGKITGATVYDDNPTTFPGGWSPKEWYTGFKGLMNMRTAIEVSANIPHAKALSNIGIENSIDFCEKVGLPKFESEGLSLALGGLHEGVSVFQMAGAYSAIANDGVFNKPTFYTKVTDREGNVIFEPEQESNRVMSEQNAYIEKNILTQTVVGASGTAKYCAIKGMEVAAKTGTTNDDNDRWLCGFTPYYTAAVWYGYEFNQTVHYNNGNPAGRIWAAVMTDIHKDLPNANFERPEGIIEKTICRTSGKLATEACGANVYTEVFTESNAPTESCEGHVKVRICLETGLVANEGCTQIEERIYTARPEREQNPVWTTTGTSYDIPTEICPAHPAGAAPAPEANEQDTHTHTESEWRTDTATNTRYKVCIYCGIPLARESLPNSTTSSSQSSSTSSSSSTTKPSSSNSNSKPTTPSTPQTNTVQKPAHTTHTFSTVVSETPATCETAGKKVLKCTGCSETKTETIPAKGHTPGEWITDTPATATTAGSKHQVCSVCGKTINTETIPATGETEQNPTVNPNPQTGNTTSE